MADRLLKHDLLGSITTIERDGTLIVVRDTGTAPWWLAPIARHCARREAAALGALAKLPGLPELLALGPRRLERTFIAGEVLDRAMPASRAYFREALRLVRRLHARGVAHNDLAKEGNWLCTPAGSPAIVDFQLALRSPRRSRLFRVLAREDLRHLFKHKRTYAHWHLTARQRAMLATPTGAARAWRRLAKPVYRFVTRRLLGIEDRTGPAERGRRAI
jgi:hypothetical protein